VSLEERRNKVRKLALDVWNDFGGVWNESWPLTKSSI